DSRRDHADAVLAGLVAFDDGDVGVAHVALDSLAQLVERHSARQDDLLQGNPGEPYPRPEEYFGGAVLAEDLGLHRGRMDVKDGREVRLAAQAGEPGACAENAVMLRDDPREIRQWVWRIGNHEKHGFWRGLDDLRDHGAIDVRVLVEEPQAPFGIVP